MPLISQQLNPVPLAVTYHELLTEAEPALSMVASASPVHELLTEAEPEGGFIPINVVHELLIDDINLSGSVTPTISPVIHELLHNQTVLYTEFPETWTLDLIIDIVPSLNPSQFARYRPRFRADGVDIPITDFNYSESQAVAGGEVQVTLARIADRELFAQDTEIDFGFGFITAGVWDESTMDWKIFGGSFNGWQLPIGWADNAPTDKAVVNGSSELYDKLNVTAESGIIFFDTAVETVAIDEIEPIYDENGVSYLPELVGINGMTLYDVLDRVLITECGFDSYEAPPDYPLRRVDCPMGASLWDAVSGFLGMYDTEVVVENNVLKIIDTTLVSPDGFPIPKQVGVENYQTLSVTESAKNLDGLIVNISENKRNYDFVTQRFENETLDGAGDTSTSIEREFREYRKFAYPYIVIRDELARITKSTFGSAGTVYDLDDRYTYDSRDLVSLRIKEIQNLLPDVTTGESALRLESEEREEFSYAAHPFKARQVYLQKRELTVRGLVIRDAQNQQLGRDFIQPYSTSSRSGNLQDGQTIESDFLIKIERETFEPLRGGQVRHSEYEYDGTANSGDGLVVKDGERDKPGDVALNDISPHPTQIIVFAEDNHTRTKQRLVSVNYGELPQQLAIPLARRSIKRSNEKPRRVDNMNIIGYDPLALKGFVIDAQGRDGTLGNYLILSLNISGDAVSIFTNVTGIQV